MHSMPYDACRACCACRRWAKTSLMADNHPIPKPGESEISPLLAAVRAQTPARLLVGRAGPSYLTRVHLQLREDHAAARDAVHAEIELARDLGADLIERFKLFEVKTRARDKQEYLLRPDLGRLLDDAGRELLRKECPVGPDLQVIIGDGLSCAALTTQVPALLPLLGDAAAACGWKLGRPFFVRHCRVGILNDAGDLLQPTVAVLLIGERPGLATAESLSAYMAYRPRRGHTDAERNLISNIHARGVSHANAVQRIIGLAERMRTLGASGVSVKEQMQARIEST